VAVTALVGVSITAFPQSARSRQPVLRCGTPDINPTTAKRLEYNLNKLMTGRGSFEPVQNNLRTWNATARRTVTIPVYFHVITAADTTTGNLTDAQIQAQIDVLNRGFSGQDKLANGTTPNGTAAVSPFRFVLRGIDRTADDRWFTYQEVDRMKQALRRGNAGTLNVYSMNAGVVGLLGIATFPYTYNQVSASGQVSNAVLDGVIIAYDSLPGFPGPYGLGKTLVHEVGHWVGLYHTFQGSCTKANDFVDDTPAQAYSFYGNWLPGTVPGRIPDTCTGRYYSGKDPVENYMDYTDDSGYYRFTPGQVTRMSTLCRAYRGLF
jgi:hypothetical protein